MPLENGYYICVVLLYSRLEHYGFIAAIDEDIPDVFVHESQIVKASESKYLVRGQKCAFKVDTNPRNGKLMAVSVIPLADPIVIPPAKKPTAALGTPVPSPTLGGNRER
jgi:cold shock CspA family protein